MNIQSTHAAPVPSVFWGPWFLTTHVSTQDPKKKNRDRALDQAETDCTTTEEADSPCYIARSFERILKYLPRVPDLRGNYKRRASDKYEMISSVFYVVENYNKIFVDPFEARQFHISTTDPTLGIYALANRADAEDLVNADELIARHATVQLQADQVACML
ncbi:hypothetical protein C8F04DRAFT_1195941 [Mycena alexandri]|uniref:Uncharacterized protein n=1 Tax=Mycena alexandri TaxID=1745969 RepID=A0AAD6S709_9AGAR|nr:hypothetical protein C8F04DRAFT_1195941 [Mycena alexandri]